MIGVDARYSLNDHLELLFGARYWDYEAVLFAAGPGALVRETRGRQSWIDPLIGARVTIPIGPRWSLTGRGDIGGFGVGSDFAWHATVFFEWQAAERFSRLLGYRIIDVDFEDGSGAQRFRVDLLQSGPALGASFSF